MNTESKGRAWYDKIYRKLETILVEVDNLASQGKVSSESIDHPPGSDSVRDEPEKLAEDHCSGTFDMNHRVDLPRCKSPSYISSDHKFDIPRSVPLEEQMLGDSLKKKLSDSTLTEIQAAPVQDKVANIRAFTSNSMNVNQDEFFIEDFDDAPLDTIDLYDMTFREDPSDFDDNLLYAARDKTRQLRSFKRKIMDALTSKRRREKEYEQLAVWFGDADMGCDLINTKEHATTSLDSKSSQSNVPFASEDSEWELL